MMLSLGTARGRRFCREPVGHPDVCHGRLLLATGSCKLIGSRQALLPGLDSVPATRAANKLPCLAGRPGAFISACRVLRGESQTASVWHILTEDRATKTQPWHCESSCQEVLDVEMESTLAYITSKTVV